MRVWVEEFGGRGMLDKKAGPRIFKAIREGVAGYDMETPAIEYVDV